MALAVITVSDAVFEAVIGGKPWGPAEPMILAAMFTVIMAIREERA